jgi:hypothetical protein
MAGIARQASTVGIRREVDIRLDPDMQLGKPPFCHSTPAFLRYNDHRFQRRNRGGAKLLGRNRGALFQFLLQ